MAKSEKINLRAEFEKALRRLKRNRRFPEDDPYACVTAPRKPKPPLRNAAAAADPPKD